MQCLRNKKRKPGYKSQFAGLSARYTDISGTRVDWAVMRTLRGTPCGAVMKHAFGPVHLHLPLLAAAPFGAGVAAWPLCVGGDRCVGCMFKVFKLVRYDVTRCPDEEAKRLSRVSGSVEMGR